MTKDDLPDLSDWLYVENWTIEEAAMLWGAIDPYHFIGIRLADIMVDPQRHRRAMICQRAIVEAVCNGTLSTTRAIVERSDFNNCWEEEIKFPNLPDPDTLIPHRTRIAQSSFRAWAAKKNIPSYRMTVLKSVQLTNTAEPETVVFNEAAKEPIQLLAAPSPAYMDPANSLSSIELRAAHDAWHAITKNGTYDPRQHLGISVKDATFKFLEDHPEYREFSNQAKERVFGVINWNKSGGAPRTPNKPTHPSSD
ncbi:hypothetical protein [Massilia sp. YMA4]|uniref:hypothetical protein n=1 Tax=Massilia sp. YMA4 TaxID=1593482 RepID=UPI001581B797|nr:hypothetical protein [Massilia sp. YMA4]